MYWGNERLTHSQMRRKFKKSNPPTPAVSVVQILKMHKYCLI